MTGHRPVVDRPTARTIVLDHLGRVLLFQIEDLPFPDSVNIYPDRPRVFWITPGGGVEPGETFEAAARRELLEETGLAAPLGPCLLEEEVLLHKPDRDILFRIRFYLVRVAAGEISLDGLDAIERGVYRSHRWWRLDELVATTETIYPPQLADLLRARAGRAGAGCG